MKNGIIFILLGIICLLGFFVFEQRQQLSELDRSLVEGVASDESVVIEEIEESDPGFEDMMDASTQVSEAESGTGVEVLQDAEVRALEERFRQISLDELELLLDPSPQSQAQLDYGVDLLAKWKLDRVRPYLDDDARLKLQQDLKTFLGEELYQDWELLEASNMQQFELESLHILLDLKNIPLNEQQEQQVMEVLFDFSTYFDSEALKIAGESYLQRYANEQETIAEQLEGILTLEQMSAFKENQYYMLEAWLAGATLDAKVAE